MLNIFGLLIAKIVFEIATSHFYRNKLLASLDTHEIYPPPAGDVDGSYLWLQRVDKIEESRTNELATKARYQKHL